MTRVDRRKATASEFRRLFLRLTGRLKRSADRGEGGDADLRLDFADVNAARIGASPPSEALTRSPLPAGDPRFIPREDIRAAIEHSHAAWREGRPTLIALTGPSGCGLTSILNQTPSWLPADTLVARIDLSKRPDTSADALALAAGAFEAPPPFDTVDSAANQINALAPRVILIDNGHLLYSRLIGGSEGGRALHGLMIATQGKHLWLLACETQAWRRQCDTAGAHRYFDITIEADYFSRVELASLLSTRTPDGSPSFDDAAIDALHRVSRGHPGLALFIAACIRRADTPTLPAPFDESPLWALERTELLTLAEISAHGMLSANELQSIFRRDPTSTSILLHHLRQSGLIVGSTGNQLQPLLAPMINAHLVRANYLY